MKTIKGLLAKSPDPYLALLSYRATPLQNGYSSAQLCLGRILRTTPSNFLPKWPNLMDLAGGEIKCTETKLKSVMTDVADVKLLNQLIQETRCGYKLEQSGTIIATLTFS